MNILKITIDALLRKGQDRYKTDRVEINFYFDTREVGVIVQGQRIETIKIPEKEFEMLCALLRAQIHNDSAELKLLIGSPNDTTLYYHLNGQKLMFKLI
jgi:hypothetical protein